MLLLDVTEPLDQLESRTLTSKELTTMVGSVPQCLCTKRVELRVTLPNHLGGKGDEGDEDDKGVADEGDGVLG